MKEPEKLIVFERTDYPNDMHIKTINMRLNSDMPYKEFFIKKPYCQREQNIFQFGNIVDYFPGTKTWRLDYEYRHPSHGYDIVVVLGIIDNSEILVDGDKTPRTTIKCDPSVIKYKAIQRGDWLLLEKIYSTPYIDIVHNINQEQLVFKRRSYTR